MWFSRRYYLTEPTTAFFVFILVVGISELIWGRLISEVNKAWPPLHLLDQRGQSVINNHKILNNLKSDLYLEFSDEILRNIINSGFDELSEDSKKDNITLENLNVEFGKQVIKLSIDFEIPITDLDITVNGSFYGGISPYIKDNYLLLNPAIETLKVNNITGKGKDHDVEIVVPLINNFFKLFIANINQELQRHIKPTSLDISPIDIDENTEKDIKNSDQNIGQVSMEYHRLNLLFKSPVILITESSLIIQSDASINLSKLPAPEDPPPKTPKIPPYEGPPWNEKDFVAAYDSYLNDFAMLSSEHKSSINNSHYAFASVNKLFLSRGISDLFKRTRICIDYNLNIATESSSSNVGLVDREEFDCSVDFIDCRKRHDRNCSIDHLCGPLPACNHDCDSWDIGCHLRKWECEISKAAMQIDCGLKKFDCERIKSIEIAKCEAWKLLQNKGCEAAKELVSQIGDWGRITSRATVSGIASSCIHKISPTNDFNRIDIDLDISAHANIYANLRYSPSNTVGTLLTCSFGWNETFNLQGTIEPNDIATYISVSHCLGTDSDSKACKEYARDNSDVDFSETLVLGLSIPEFTIPAKYDPPIASMLHQKPYLVFNCRFLDALSILNALKIGCDNLGGGDFCTDIYTAWGEIMEGKFIHDAEEQQFAISIDDWKGKLSDVKTTSTVHWKKNHLQIILRKISE
ncbi:MAG: hypothetical protein JAZ17_07910 [Candidatus Thiodiazotropha endolucinida]|nr:hypothetical protein [Candidatus Thiodiazotropha endolucinida]